MEKKVFEDLKINKLSDIIRKGDSVGVKITPESEWISDIVLEINDEENILNIELLDVFISDNLMVDDFAQCKLINDETVYIFDGKIKDVGITHSKKVIIEILDIKKYPNERTSPRFTVNLCGRLIYDGNEKSTFVTVKNISSTGISVVSKEFLGINEEVDVDIVLWKKEVLSIEGKIIRMFKIGRNYKYGILIENMDQKSKDLLDDFINDLEYFERMKKISEE